MKILIPLLLFCLHAYPQDYPRENVNLQRIADDLYGFQDLDMNYGEIFENVAQLFAHPIDLNKAQPEDLSFLKILNDEQITNLMAYRNENGNLLSVYELQSVPGFDLSTIYTIIPMVTVSDPHEAIDRSLWARIKHESDRYLVVRYERILQQKEGYSENAEPEEKFLGSPDKLYVRFRSSKPGDFSVGFTAEKDAGEAFTWAPKNNQFGADYLSFHAQLQNKGRMKNLIVGDFQNQFGQGLALGGIFGMGKGGETITTTRRTNIGHLPYTSVYETGQLRGIAATLELRKNLYWHPFYSAIKRDATLDYDEQEESIVSSFQSTGLHRNEKEVTKRKRIGEQNFGSILQYKKDNLDVGILFNQVRFERAVQKNETIYNTYSFQGNRNQNIALYANYAVRNFAFFGEVAHSLSFGNAFVIGLLTNPTRKFDLALHFRKFDRNYYSFYASAFAEGSTTQNEAGMYWGWKYTFNRRYSVSGYLDLFQFPWIKYRSYTPSHGHEGLLRFVYQPTRKIAVTVQLREEVKVRNMGDTDAALYHTGTGLKRNLWAQASYDVSDNIHMNTRAQVSTFRFIGRRTTGATLLQDIRWSLNKIEVTFRYALFDTDDYDNRHYVYENDVWLAYSLPAYSGSGIRNYLLLEYKVNRQVSLWVRYAHTRFTDRDEIGNGDDQIAGSVQDDLKVQMRLKF